MKKNLLLSLVAMSAPMVAFANADLTKKVPQEDGNEGKWSFTKGSVDGKLDIDANGVFTSPAGSSLSYTTEVLKPGKYSFSIANNKDNATVVLSLVDGKGSVKGSEVTIDEDAKIKIDIKAPEAEKTKPFSVSGLKLELVFDFQNAATEFTNKLGACSYANIKYQDLKDIYAKKVDEIAKKINEINVEANTYEVYVSYELYNGVDKSPLTASINALAKEIGKALVIDGIRDYAVLKYNDLQAKFKTITYANVAKPANVNKDGNNQYAWTKYNADQKNLVSNANTEFDGVLAENFYEDANYATKFSKENVDANVAKYKAEVEALQNNINAAILNDNAYVDVKAASAQSQQNYLNIVAKLTELMKPNAGQQENVYVAMRNEVRDLLAAEYAKITVSEVSPVNKDFMDLLGTEADHDKAAVNKADMVDLISSADAFYDEQEKAYTDKYNNEFAAYKAVIEQLATYKLELTSEQEKVEKLVVAKNNVVQAIAAVQTWADAQNKDYKLTGAAVDYSKVEADYKVFRDLKTADTQNRSDYKALNAAHKSVSEALADAVKAVSEMKYEAKSSKFTYQAANYNSAETLNALLANYQVPFAGDYNGEEVYIDDKNQITLADGTVLTVTRNADGVVESVDKFNELSTLISKYQTTASTDKDTFQKFDESINGDQAKLTELKKTVGDFGYVTASANNVGSETTYGQHITRYEGALNAAVAELMAVAGKNDVAVSDKKDTHTAELQNFVYEVQLANITSDVDHFAKDKKDFINNNNMATARERLQQATNELGEVRGLYEQSVTANKGTGSKTTEFDTQLNEINNLIEAQATSIANHEEIVGEGKNPTEEQVKDAILKLQAVRVEIESIKNKLTRLQNNISKQVDLVNNNKQHYANLLGENGTLTEVKKEIAKITVTDPNTTLAFVAQVATNKKTAEEASAEISKLIEATRNAELLYVGCDEKLLEEAGCTSYEDIVKKIDTLTTDVSDFVSDAVAVQKNYDLYLAAKVAYYVKADVAKPEGVENLGTISKVDDAINPIKLAAPLNFPDNPFTYNKKVTLRQSSQDYYNGVLSGYSTSSKQNILDAFTADYEAMGLTDQKVEGYKTAVEEKLANVGKVKAAAFDNEVAYYLLVEGYENDKNEPVKALFVATQEYWQEASGYISTNDKTPNRDQHLQDLDKQLALLLGYKGEVEAKFKEGGLTFAEYQAYSTKNSNVNHEIALIRNTQADKDAAGFDQTVRALSSDYIAEVNKLYTVTDELFTKGAEDINNYQSIVDKDLTAKFAEKGIDFQTYVDNLSTYMTQVRVLNKQCKDAYASYQTGEPALKTQVFDYPGRKYYTDMKAQRVAIENSINALKALTDAAGKEVRDAKVVAAEAAVTAAENALVATGCWSDADKENLFVDINNQIQEAKKYSPNDWAWEFNNSNHLTNLNNVDANIKEQKVVEAQNQWQVIIAKGETQDELTKQFEADKQLAYPVNKSKENTLHIALYDLALNNYYQNQWNKDVYTKSELNQDGLRMAVAQVVRAANNNSGALADNNFSLLKSYKKKFEAAVTECGRIHGLMVSQNVNKNASDEAYLVLSEKGTFDKDGKPEFVNTFNNIDKLQTSLDDYVSEYMISLDEKWFGETSEYAKFKEDYAKMKNDVLTEKDNGTLHNSQPTYISQLDGYANTELDLESGLSLFAEADAQEIIALEAQLLKMQNEIVELQGGRLDTYTEYLDQLKQHRADLETARNLAAGKKHDNLLNLQTRVAASFKAMHADYSVELETTFTQRITDVENDINALKNYLVDVHQDTKDTYGATAKAAATDIATVKAFKEAHPDELYFYEDYINSGIASVENLDLKSVLEDAKAAEKLFTDHNAVIDDIYKPELDKRKEFFATVKKEIAGFDNGFDYAEDYKDIQKAINDETVRLESIYDKDDKLPSDYAQGKDIYNQILALQKKAVGDQFDLLIKVGYDETTETLVDVNYATKTFAESDKADLDKRNTNLKENYAGLRVYFNQLLTPKKIDGQLWRDVDICGNPLPGNRVFKVNFSEDYKEVLEKLQNSENGYNKQVEQLREDINKWAVVKGCMTPGQTEPSSSDYTVILNTLIENEYNQMPDQNTEARAYDRFMMRGDLNGDGKILINDLTLLVNKMRGITPSATVNFVHSLALSSAKTDQLALSVSGEGTTQRIAINLNNVNRYVAAQMDIKLPEGVKLLGESLSERAGGHDLYSNDLQNGTHRVVVSSMNNDVIADSEGAVIYLDVEVSHNYQGAGIEVSNVMFVDEGSRIFHLNSIAGGEATGVGTVTLTQEMKSKVYNMGGQLLNGVKKGVNIIMMKDGSVKKVFKK